MMVLCLLLNKACSKETTLKIFASRAGAELDRLDALKKLEKANAELEILLKDSDERYRDLFEEAPIAYVNETLDSQFIRVNRAALRILGVRPEDVPNTFGPGHVRAWQCFVSVIPMEPSDGGISGCERRCRRSGFFTRYTNLRRRASRSAAITWILTPKNFSWRRC